MKTVSEINDFITVLFEVLTEEKLKRFDERAKQKENEDTIASLHETIKVSCIDYRLEFDKDK